MDWQIQDYRDWTNTTRTKFLAKLAKKKEVNGQGSVCIKHFQVPIISQIGLRKVAKVVVEKMWMDDIRLYLKKGGLPADKLEAKKLR